MKTDSTGFLSHLATGTTTLAWCWKITRVDGEVFGFTDHDLNLSFEGITFEPDSGLIPGELRAGSDLSVDAQDAEGVLTSDQITETDILDGLWDNASVEVWRVNWSDPSERLLMRRGSIGQVRRGRTMFIGEVRSMAHTLNQTVGRTYQGSCDAVLGDGRCKVALGGAAYSGSGQVIDTLRGRTYRIAGLGAFVTGWFDSGVLSWTSGPNAGRKAEVLLHEVTATDVLVTLQYDPVRPVEDGDLFTITAGCNKSQGDCQGKFANIANFRGFPDIPGQTTIYRYAKRAGSNSGEPL